MSPEERDGMTLLAGRLWVPVGTKAILWDMDCTLVDTLTPGFELIHRTLQRHAPAHPASIGMDGWSADETNAWIRRNFGLAPREFWRKLHAEGGVALDDDRFETMLREYGALRQTLNPPPAPGILDVLEDARSNGIVQATVSNNPAQTVEKLLGRAGLLGYMTLLVGDDMGLPKKPAPDMYVKGCNDLGVDPADAAVAEDSIIGLKAGWSAGCYTIGVATGADPFDAIARSGYASACYESFAEGARSTVLTGDIKVRRRPDPGLDQPAP